jgi:Ca2+-binding RTX toxin-like protein
MSDITAEEVEGYANEFMNDAKYLALDFATKFSEEYFNNQASSTDDYLDRMALEQYKIMTESERLALKTAENARNSSDFKKADYFQRMADRFSSYGDQYGKISSAEYSAITYSRAFSALGKFAGVAGAALDFYTIQDKYKNGDYDGATTAFAGVLFGAIAFGLMASMSAPLWAVVGASIIASYLVEKAFPGWDSIFSLADSVHDFFARAFSWRRPPFRDPLTLDLDGDGLETIGIDSGRLIYFDHNNDGVKTATGWVASDDGFLVLDRNGDGIIDSGAELFGDSTPLADGSLASDGFAALAEQDTNGDGQVDADDANWTDLKIWRDLNQNGVSEASELQSLDEVGIRSLTVDAQSHSQTLSNGNRIADLGRFEWVDGRSGEIEGAGGQTGDVDLTENAFYREFTESVPVTEEAKALPTMRGAGAVRDLREAVSLSPELASLLSEYSQSDTREAQLMQLDELLAAWANSSDQTSSVEQAAGKGYQLIYVAPGMSGAGAYENYLQYWEAGEAVLAGLVATDRTQIEALKAEQTQFARMITTLERFNGQPFVAVGDTGVRTGAGGWVSAAMNTNGVKRVYVSLSSTQVDLLQRSYDALVESTYDGLVVQTRLRTYLDSIVLSYDDTTDDSSVDFSGLEAKLNDTAIADAAHGLIDLIELNRYLGDTLRSAGWDAEGRLRTEVAAAAGNAALETVLSDLHVVSGDGQLDGSSKADVLLGGVGNDRLNAHDGNDLLSGDAGNDRLYGDAGRDILRGGAGNDQLYGGRDDDLLIGGAGDDYLDGGLGNDTYRFGYGSGHDVIASSDSTSGKLDVVEFEAGVESDAVALTRTGNDLLITLGDGTDQLRVRNYFGYESDNSYSRVEQLKFADGTVWNVEAVKMAVLLSSGDTETLIGYDTDDVIDAGNGNDVVYGRSGNDTLSGATGNDRLYGENDDDVLSGGEGSDYLYGGAGADVLDGGAGNDMLDGGAGNDLYRVGYGSGQDAISNYDTATDRLDVVEFAADVTPTDATLRRSGDHLVVTLVGSDDRLTINNYFRNDAAAGGYRVEELRFSDGTVWDVEEVKRQVLVPTEEGETLIGYATADTLDGAGGNDAVYGRAGNDVLDGSTGDDHLYGEDGADTLLGGEGYDRLAGGAGDDVLDGGTGNDWLDGGAGSDIYRFGLGSGQDTISSYDETEGKVDAVEFGAGILPADVTLRRSGDNLVMSVAGSDDQVTVSNYFWWDANTGERRVEELRFADGTVWDVAEVKRQVLTPTDEGEVLVAFDTDDVLDSAGGNDTVYGRGGDDSLSGGAGADSLYGEEGNDILDGGEGNDRLWGGNGLDTLNGGEGNDTLYGDGGDDVLDGGAGNDWLSGGYGSDLYRFGRGSGQDTISSYAYRSAADKVDAVEFGAELTPSDVTLRRSGNHLVVMIAGSDDRLTVSNYFWNDANTGEYRVEELRFADGTVWDVAEVKRQVLVPTDEGETLIGYETADTIDGAGGDDVLHGHGGDDVISGGTGDDTVYGEDGADTLNGEEGGDYLYGGAGDDVLDGGAGNDWLKGGSGSDLYRFGYGSGQDIISSYVYQSAAEKTDAVEFSSDILPADVTLRRSNNDLVMTLAGSDDRLTVSGYFWNDANTGEYRVEELRFADGTVWNVAEVKRQVLVPTDEGETLIGYETADTIDGAGGDDVLHGHGGDDVISGSTGGDALYGEEGNDILDGGEGNDQLWGGNGLDMLSGGEGVDSLYGDSGDDVLDGGAGNDWLSGGAGSDLYRFGYGSGQDIISNYVYQPAAEKTDAVAFSSDILPADVTLRRSNNDLVMTLAGSDDRLTVSGYFRNDANTGEYRVEELRFADGTVWDVAEVKRQVLIGTAAAEILIGYDVADTIDGLEGDDYIYAHAGNDTISGSAGNDRLYGDNGDDVLSGGEGLDELNGGNGNDVLSGDEGDDRLYGDAGNDRLIGGLGDDVLVGGAGDDTYVFARGDGQDTVYAIDSTAGRQEIVEFAADIAPADILARRRGNDLVLESVDGNDRVTISSHFLNETANDSTIQEVRFADGTVWTLADLNDLVLHGSAAADVLEGHAADDAMTGAAGDDTLYGRAGDDVLDGGEGADTLYGETGNDTLIGGAGADRLEGGAGDDVYEIAAGEGQDTLLDTAGADRIRLTDLAPSEVLARREGLDLVLSRVSDGQVLARVEGEFSNVADVPGATAVETVEFSDGTTWDYAAIKLQALAGTESADRIEGHAEADLIQSLGGDDVVLAAAGDDEIHGGTGSDELHGGAGADVLYGDGDDDTLYGGDDNDRLEGGLGADTLDGGAGDDVLLGGDGNDILQGSSGTDRLEGGEGDDTLQGNGELYGDAGADTLEGTGLLSGGAGDDTLTGLGSDELLGGDGNDVLTANTDIWISGTGSVLEGGAGDDVLYGSFADDTYRFNVGDGNDRLIERRTGESYSNIVPSFDTLSFGAGVALADLAFERHGDDLLVRHANGADSITIERWFEEPTDHFKVNRFTFADGTELSDADVEARVVTYGTAEADTLFGYRALDEELYAGDGDDQVWGRDGDDALYGEAGADYLDGEAGADRLYGGAGADNLQGRDGNDVLDGGLDDDSLSGGVGDDVLLGQAGDDNLFGDGGADQLEGGAGDDYLTGGDGADVLLGGDGADQLGGDAGDDQLRGGLGDDKYVYASGQGADVVDNSDGGYDGVFFTDVGLDRLAFSRDGDDLLIAVDGDPAQSVRVLDHFLGGDAAIDYVQPNGGNMLDTQHIAHIVAANGLEGGYATAVVGSEGADSLSAYDSRDLVQGLGGDDTLWGMAGDDRIEGGAGNDALYGGNGSGQGSGTDELVGGDGDDVLNGEDGNDVLMGGAGNDDYYYGEGDGVDVIDNAGGGTDTVFFVGGIDRGRLSFHQDGDDLVMLLDGDLTQQVRVLGHFLGGEAAISYVQPTDGGYAIPAGDIAGMLTALPGDSSSGGSGDTGGTTPPDGGGDTGGDTDTDTPPTAQTGGADSLTGTAGNDVLLGGADNDTLDGNGGSDLLRGGVGDDTYVFGGGQAVLAEEDGADTLRFTNGITFNSVASGLMKSGDDLVLMVNGGPDQVTLQGFFRGGSELIETITFDTGGSLTADQIFGAFGMAVPDGISPYAATVEGSNGDDALVQGGTDAERLLGYNGADTLEGAGGDDLLIGGRGDDTYVFRSGDGQDVIDNTGGGYDTLQFADAGFNDVASGLMKSGDDLVLKVSGGPDQVTLRGFFRGGDEAIDRLVFSDGSLLDKAQIFGAFGLGDPDPDGSPDYSGLPDERAYGTVQAARADGETLFGSSDADLIDGGAGNDVIDGGIGDDWLIGGRGDDVFMQGRDGGADTITAYDPTAGKTDTLRFGADIGIDQLWFERSGDDLSVSIIGTGDSATVSGWYAGEAYHVERIETADGHVLLDAQVENLVSAMAAFAPPAAGETNLPASYQDDLQPVIAANWQ